MTPMARRTAQCREAWLASGRRLARAAATWGVTVASSLASVHCATGARSVSLGSAPSPTRAPVSVSVNVATDPLLRANGDFHVEYAAARALEQATLGTSRPYLLLAEDKLVLRYRGNTVERSLSSPRFDAVKDASHVPIAVLSAILANRDSTALRELAQRIRQVEPAITATRFGDVEQPAHGVVRESLSLLEAALVKTPSEADLHDFGLRTRSDTTKLLQAGCDELLRKLDLAVRELRPTVGDAWSQAVVVITTDHQSRADEVGTQYFEHLFHERAREGALGEARIVILENIGPNDGAMQTMASHLYDQRLSTLLFDDPTFLQGDVLGKHVEPTITRLLATPF
jgi:hypothetical protein